MRLHNFLFVGLGVAMVHGIRHILYNTTRPIYDTVNIDINMLGASTLQLYPQYLLPKIGASVRTQLLVTTGEISAFTTSSAITREMVERIHAHQSLWAFGYLALTLLLGLCAAALGTHLAQRWANATNQSVTRT